MSKCLMPQSLSQPWSHWSLGGARRVALLHHWANAFLHACSHTRRRRLRDANKSRMHASGRCYLETGRYGLAAREREACRKQRSRYSSACTFMKMLNRCQHCQRRGHYHWRRFAASNTAPGRGQLRCRLRLCADAVSSVCALAMAWARGICPRRARA